MKPSSDPRLEWLGRARMFARLGYVVILLIATLTPYRVDLSAEGLHARIERVWHPDLGNHDLIDAARNVVLFAGWGAVWALTAVSSLRAIVRDATLTGMLLSATVEFAQLFTSNRVTSLVDVGTNTGGAFAGALGLLFLAGLANQRRNARSFVGIPTIYFAASYGLAVWLEAVIPLFRHDDLVSMGGPSVRMAAALAAMRFGSILDLPWGDFFIFTPAGALAVAALTEHGLGYLHARNRVIAAAVVLAFVAELLHGPQGQPIVLGSVLLHAAAVSLGAWAAARWLPTLTVALRGAARVRALMIGYLLVLAAWAWRPYLPEYQMAEITGKLTREWYIPLNALGMAPNFFSVVDVCAPFFLYLPLGALLAVWPWRQRGWLAGPLAGVWVATALEVSQILVLGRTLDITDIMITSSGVLVGWAIFRRAGYPVYGEVFG
jgi:glycopeptide antibiotics resistance protein